MPAPILDFDGCGDGDRAHGYRWSSTGQTQTSTDFGTFGYGMLIAGTPSRSFDAVATPHIGMSLNSRDQFDPTSGHFFQFREGTKVNLTVKFPLTGKVEVYDASGALVAATAAGVWLNRVWQVIEVQIAVASGSVGVVNVWLFGNTDITPDLTATLCNTIASGGTGVTDNILFSRGSQNTHWIDDLFIMDASAGYGALGGCRIGKLSPNSDVSTDWTPSGGSGGNYNRVNEIPFSATQKVSSTVDGDVDEYGLETDGVGFNVLAVRAIAQMKRGDASAAKARTFFTDGTVANGVTRDLAGSSAVYADIITEQPSGGDIDLSTLHVGVERVAV